jgi:tRNA threonylcarbamoyladenosine biosynthesis protein TsaB
VNLLAIDTSSLACSVALRVGDVVIERHEEQAREHTRLLTPMIREVLTESGMHLPRLDAIVLGNGPGSFIGMRIAASVAQGLAHGAGLSVVPVWRPSRRRCWRTRQLMKSSSRRTRT